MKKLITFFVCSTIISIQAQTVLYSENFEGASPTVTMNTTDQSSTGGGYNHWIINNSYSGGSFTDPCFGFSTPIGATASQPGAITNSPNSKYMHIVNTDAEAQGVTNANFLASDGNAFCVGDQNYFAKMTTPIVTTGQTGVTLSFYWLCAGSSVSVGEVYYSTNGGSSWFLHIGNLQGQSSWTLATYTNATWDNQASLLFGFRFVNGTTFSASDPPFSIDEISVSVPAANSITPGNVTLASPYCAGENLVVAYTITGTFTGANVFSAELSDGSGSFAFPTVIGSVMSTSNGNINCNIPSGTATGSGYQIRVVGSTPITIGSSSGPITIDALPVPAPTNTGPYCAGNTINLNAAAGSIDYDWVGPNAYNQPNTQNPTIATATVAMSGVYTVTATNAAGCSSASTTTVTVNPCAGIEDETVLSLSVYPNPTADVFTIAVDENILGDAKVTLYNMVGESVYNFTPNQSKTIISTETLGLKAGIYLVQVKSNGHSKVVRLIIR